MNNKITIAILFLNLFWSCKHPSPDTKSIQSNPLVNHVDSTIKEVNLPIIEKEQIEITPDTTINNKLKLHNYSSIEFFIRDYNSVKTVEEIRESPIAAFKNSTGNEYLFASHYEGNTQNSFSLFEIGYMKDVTQDVKFYPVEETSFETESGIHLSLPLKDLIEIKGEDYKISFKNDTIITYRINSGNNSRFLSKYNMPGYIIECRIRNAKIINFKFGFDYP